MVTVEQLYKDFGVLADAKDKAGEHQTEFLSIVSGVKGGSNEKRLASQFITRFFKYFPDLAEQVLDAMFDLCEDEDINIRRQAIKDLPTLCKGSPQHLPRIADVLTQLLQTEEPAEISMVQSALINLFHTDAKGCLNGLFSQILQGDDMVRERGIKFLHSKLQTLTKEIWTSDVETMFITESRKVLKDVTGEEFIIFIDMLSKMESMKTLKGRQELLDIVTEQAELEQPFEASDPDSVDRLMQCVRQALPFFSKNVHSGKFVVYICDKVLPELDSIKETEAAEGTPAVDLQLELIKLLAEMSPFMGEIENVEERLEKLFARLLEYMPLPPSEENAENTNENETPKLQFSYVECLMYCFHQMAPKHPDFLVAEDNAERLKDFRLRLQYFARGVQVYIKQLKMALQDKTGEALKTDENKIKVVALKITNNINTLIKDLFHNPPAYKAHVNLSWKPIVAATKTGAAAPISPGQKRPSITPITFEGGAKKSKQQGDRAMYAPPSGKFSDKAGTFNPGQNRGRGGFRGRGAGFRGGRGRGRGGNFRGSFNRNYNNYY